MERPLKKVENHVHLLIFKIRIKILFNKRLYAFTFWNGFTTLKWKNINMYIIEKLLSMNF
jgi:hypothetical protein